MPQTAYVRRHSVTLLEPNLLLVRLCGDVLAEDIRELHLQRLRMITPGPLFHMMDLSQLGSFGPDARKTAVQSSKALAYKAMAVFGASRTARTLLTLLWTARALLTASDARVHFTNTEAEARAWVDEQRANAGVARPST